MQSPGPADVHTAAFCSTQRPSVCVLGLRCGPSSAAKASCGDGSLGSQSTHRLGVWSDGARLASCHLFPGLLKTGQVQRSCLAGAAFLETTGEWREAGLWLSQHRSWSYLLTGSWVQAPHTAHSVVCLHLLFDPV